MVSTMKFTGLAVLLIAFGASSSRAALVLENVTWHNPVGPITISGNTITRSPGAIIPPSVGANSVQIIRAGNDGYAEVIAMTNNQLRVFGLQDVVDHMADGSDPHNMDTIDFGIQLNANGILRIRENGGVIRRMGGVYNPNDVLRIERSGTNIRYLQNGLLVYQSVIPSSSALVLDASLKSGQAEVAKAVITSIHPEPATLAVWSLVCGSLAVAGRRRRWLTRGRSEI